MAGQPAISVVVPTHNVGVWVRECLSSILDDQDVDLEVIVVDDKSTDETWDVVAALAADDPRVRMVRSMGSGGAQARNLGVELARGEYLVFCDGDDLVPRRSYARMLASARATGSDMVVGRFRKFWATQTWRPTLKWPAFDTNRVGVTLLDATSLIRNRACWNRMFRRQFWIDQCIYFPSVPRSNDIVPMTKALISAKGIDVITDDVYLYRGRPGDGSMSSQAASLESYVGYLSQEFACCALVTSMDSADLQAEYADLFLAHDGWVHLRGFLNEVQTANYEKDELEWARRHLVSALDCLDTEAVERLSPEARWVHALALEGQWAAAARLMRAIKPATETMPEGMWWLENAGMLEESSLFTPTVLGVVLGERLINPLVDGAYADDPDLPGKLAFHADVFQRADFADVGGPLSVGGHLLLPALRSGHEDVIRARLADGLVSLRTESAAMRRGRVHLRAAVSGGQINKIALYAESGTTRRRFSKVKLSAETGHVEASLPVFKLPVGEWSLRVVVRDSASPLDARLSVPKGVVTRRGSRWTKAVFRRHESLEEEYIAVRRSALTRAAGKITRKVSRRARARVARPMV